MKYALGKLKKPVQEEQMVPLIGACGLDCTQCDAYLATQANDQVVLERVVARWKVDYGAVNATTENILCDGCMAGNRVAGYCLECKIRACALGQGLNNCAECSKYACEMLEGFWIHAPAARVNLDALR